mmetsp:Transcript_25934/g.38314  ORF Transcript_25934/g.38314 Transcript_25934/m.38314 type:complete len:132 (-) Transcript_25934:255-650(-)
MLGGNSDSGTNLNNRYNSYQQSGFGYVPPATTYAEKQTNIVENSLHIQHQAEEKAGVVLSQMHAQRHQLQGANDEAYKTRQTTEQARREMAEIKAKYRQKKMRLYALIAMLSIVDLLMLLRIIKCGGSFFC